jgi:putative photosynthetic complex assembly protein 2
MGTVPRAWGTIAYHEIALVLAFLWLVLGLDRGGEPVRRLDLRVLYMARISAKLNLYFGVPKINTEFLPDPAGASAQPFPASPE